MYDVYNNAYNLGGQLNINFDRYLVKKDGDYFLAQSNRVRGKYKHRSTMNDVTFRVGVVVITITIIFIRSEEKWFSNVFIYLVAKNGSIPNGSRTISLPFNRQ